MTGPKAVTYVVEKEGGPSVIFKFIEDAHKYVLANGGYNVCIIRANNPYAVKPEAPPNV